MDLVTVVLIALLLGYIGVYLHVRRSPACRERGLVPYGPTLMLKTQRGIGLMERLGRYRRFWAAYALLSKFIVLGLMVFITGLVIYQLMMIPSIPKESALGVQYILALPGLNPIIPVVYGIVALIVCLFIHEMAHGILTKANDMEVLSTGLLFLVFPIGAFVEPNSEQIQKTTKKKRTSVYAVGAATNFIFAIIFLLLLSGMTGTLESPYEDSPMMVNIASGSPSDIAGLRPGMVLMSIDGVSISSIDDLLGVTATPGDKVLLEYVDSEGAGTLEFVSGIHVETVMKGSPAEEAGLRPKMIIKSVEGTNVPNQEAFNNAMSLTRPGDPLDITALVRDEGSGNWVPAHIETIILMSGDGEKGYMGITTSYSGMGVLTPGLLLDMISSPYHSTQSLADVPMDTLRFLALPFSGLSPLPAELAWVYSSGLMGSGAFWFLANTAYWVFWMNFMVATTNCLPAVPLDGGFILMDWLDSIVARLKKNASEEERGRIVSGIISWLSLMILFSIVMMFIGPRLF